MTLKVINNSSFDLPQYESSGASGIDLRSNVEDVIQPKDWKLIKTGLYMEIPRSFEGQIRPRSGLALKHGVTVLNSPGTIDSDYRGEIGIILINHGFKPFFIHKGDRIAQMIITSVVKVDIEEVEELNNTSRGEGGFGSTDKK